MISLKAIQTSFSPTKQALFHINTSRNKSFLSLSKSKSKSKSKSTNNSDSDPESNPPPPPPPPKGDLRKQEILAQIAMLQTQKVRVTDYLDERSAFLTNFAEKANAEFDKIGKNALKEIQEAGTTMMENLESQMQTFEESAEMNRQEIEENEKKLLDFEEQIEIGRNEGLFFKSLGKRTPVDKEKAKSEINKIKKVTKQNEGLKIRKNIYLALIGLVVVAIVDSLISQSSDWQKSIVLAVILVGLVSQLAYEQRMLSETDSTEQEKIEEDK